MNLLKHGTNAGSAILSIACVAAAFVGKMYTHCVKAEQSRAGEDPSGGDRLTSRAVEGIVEVRGTFRNLAKRPSATSRDVRTSN